MKGHDFRLLSAALLAWVMLASVLALHGGARAFLAMAVAAALGVVLALRGKHQRTRILALAAAVIVLLSVTTAGHEMRSDAGPVRQWAAQGATVLARVTVAKEPVRAHTKEPGASPVYVLGATVQEITGRGVRATVDTPVLIVGDARWSDVHWQERVTVQGTLAPATRLGPARALLLPRGAPRDIQRPPPPFNAAEPLRAGLRAAFAQVPSDPRGLAPALVDGDVSTLPANLQETMNRVGMSHLNAVSGSNVTIVLLAVLWVSGWVGIPHRRRLVVATLAVAGFVILCHPDPSVIRAAAMGIVGAMGTSLGRPRAACPALGVAIIALLAWDPWLSLSAGFALSSLATLGLVVFARPWSQVLSSRLPQRCHRLCEIVMVPVAAQVLCLPVLVLLDPRVNLMAIPANVAAEPLVAPATLGGMGVLTLYPAPTPLRQAAAWAVILPAWGIAAIARVADWVPHTTIPWPEKTTGAVLASCLIAGLALRRYLTRRVLVVGCVLASVVVSWRVPVEDIRRMPGQWRYAMCDVGQGDGGLIATGTPGHAVAIDVGPEESAGMLRCLRRHGVRVLDAVVLSHFHADHVGALSAVLREVDVGQTFVTPVRDGASDSGRGERGAGPQVDAVLRTRGRQAVPLAPGQRIDIGDLRINVLWPRRVLGGRSIQNNASLVLDVTTRDAHLLFLGDAEKEADQAIQESVRVAAERRPYDLVKVGHHGSSNQSPALYAAVRARYGAIGVGADNDYGHPSRTLLHMLQAAGTAACRTDTQGDITFYAVAGGLWPRSERGAC